MQSPIRNPKTEIGKPLRGRVQRFFVRHKGKTLGPYYARCWKENGKQRKEYVKASDLERTRKACELYRQQRNQQRLVAKETQSLIGNLLFLHRLPARARRGSITQEDQQHLERIQTEGITAQGRPPLRRPRAFMYPYLTNNQKPPLRKWGRPVSKANREGANLQPQPAKDQFNPKSEIPNPKSEESTEQKWQRWKAERATHPTPRPPIILELPTWITREKIQTLIASLPQ